MGTVVDIIETAARCLIMKHRIYLHYSAGLYLTLAGIFLVITALSLAFVGPDRFYRLLSRQGTIDQNNLTGQYNAALPAAIFNNQTLPVPSYKPDTIAKQTVLGSTNVAKRIEVDLTNQRLYAYEGENRVFDFLVSTGKWNKTPTGVFRIWIKLRYALMKGGSQALGTYYYLPNVPYTMYFSNDEHPQTEGYGIHGAYWHNNFGTPMSHGCINMKEEDVGQLYYWAEPELNTNRSIKATKENPGTEIIIYGEAPKE